MYKPISIKQIRDLAIDLENEDILAAYSLMKMVYEANQNAPLIRKKFLEYQRRVEFNNLKRELGLLNKKGEVAIVPVGFRCFTKRLVQNRLEISQPSLPFDNGFFPPHSVESILKNPKVSIKFSDKKSFQICKKYEKYNHPKYGYCIKFNLSSKEEIDLVLSNLKINKLGDFKKVENYNYYLDNSGAYFTLDTEHNYVLAHYNWSKLSPNKLSKGITDMEFHLENITSTLNRRIERMMDICHSAKKIFFIYHNSQKYKNMLIDEMKFGLEDISKLRRTANEIFQSKIHILNTSEAKLLSLKQFII